MGETTTQCCIRGCTNVASLQHTLTGQFFQYVHSYCSNCYWELMEGKQGLEIDRDKVPLSRLPVATRDYLEGQPEKEIADSSTPAKPKRGL